MRRRDFVGLIGGAAVGWHDRSNAQGVKVWRVGVVTGPGIAGEQAVKELERRLSVLGYVRDKNILLSERLPEPNLQSFENAIVSLLPSSDLLVVGGTLGGVAAKKLVTEKPVIFVSVGAPVDIGLVESLSRPGGNMTGITFEAATETYAKRLQILNEIMPSLNRVAVLHAQDDPNAKFAMTSLESAAPALGMQLIPVAFRASGDLAGAFKCIKLKLRR
jgi:putative ABC transport system substrate-binding protein